MHLNFANERFRRIRLKGALARAGGRSGVAAADRCISRGRARARAMTAEDGTQPPSPAMSPETPQPPPMSPTGAGNIEDTPPPPTGSSPNGDALEPHENGTSKGTSKAVKVVPEPRRIPIPAFYGADSSRKPILANALAPLDKLPRDLAIDDVNGLRKALADLEPEKVANLEDRREVLPSKLDLFTRPR